MYPRSGSIIKNIQSLDPDVCTNRLDPQPALRIRDQIYSVIFLGKPQKSVLVARPLRGGGGW